MKKWFGILGIFVVVALLAIYFGYQFLDSRYQRDMDEVRRSHANQIADVIREYAEKTGALPFQDVAQEQPFMVLIGHSSDHEDQFSKDPVLQRRAQFANSSTLESMLSEALGRDVKLPREPQKYPTFAPNLYVYFVSGNQMTVVSHLCYPDEDAVKYEWHETPFYSYTVCYEWQPDGSLAVPQ